MLFFSFSITNRNKQAPSTKIEPDPQLKYSRAITFLPRSCGRDLVGGCKGGCGLCAAEDLGGEEGRWRHLHSWRHRLFIDYKVNIKYNYYSLGVTTISSPPIVVVSVGHAATLTDTATALPVGSFEAAFNAIV